MNEYLVLMHFPGTEVPLVYRVEARNRQHATLVAGWNLRAYGNTADPHRVASIEAKLMRRG